MKVLVTGAAGFIGANFIRRSTYLKGKEHQFVSIDSLLYPHSKSNFYISNGKSDSFYMADIADKKIIDNIFEIEKPDIIVHFAAESHVDHSIETAAPFIHSNVLGTQTLIDCAVKHKVKTFFYISTDEVYGQLKSENEEGWDESAFPNPRNPYSASKLSGEFLVKAAHETHKLQYIISRCSNNFGPRQSTRNLIPKVIKNIAEGVDVPIYGQGQQMREWIFVEDHCDAIWHIIESKQYNQIYNISTGNEITNLELVNHIANIMGRGHNLFKFVPDRPGHDFRYSCKSDKLRALGWKPSVKFTKALESTISWYDNNRWFFK
jgi:dTDP-glucose 4,6-dehydratase